MDKKTYIAISILGITSGSGAEKDNCSAETEKIGAENAKIQSAEKSAETGGNPPFLLSNFFLKLGNLWNKQTINFGSAFLANSGFKILHKSK